MELQEGQRFFTRFLPEQRHIYVLMMKSIKIMIFYRKEAGLNPKIAEKIGIIHNLWVNLCDLHVERRSQKRQALLVAFYPNLVILRPDLEVRFGVLADRT
jgi:hypothetical protein